MYFQPVDNRVLSTQGQPDVFQPDVTALPRPGEVGDVVIGQSQRHREYEAGASTHGAEV